MLKKIILHSQSGQLILTLVLVLTVALAIGLSLVQKSLTDVSTATRTEQSTRAFSAAEAGIEQALLTIPGSGSSNFPINGGNTTVDDQGEVPRPAATGQVQEIFELPKLAKERVEQAWFADPKNNDTKGVPAEGYNQSSLDLYWGDSALDKAAILAKVVYYDSSDTSYKSISFPLDSNPNRGNNFNTPISPTCKDSFYEKDTTSGTSRKFYCFARISGWSANVRLMLIRIRMLYNPSDQPIAIQAVGSCAGCNIPRQARIINSVGSSGDTQRRVQVFKQEKVVPPYFDYAIFSTGDIKK